MTKQILIKEHFAALFKIHPSEIVIHDELTAGYNSKKYYFKLGEVNDEFILMTE